MKNSDSISSGDSANRNPGTISTGLLRDVQANGPDAWTRMSTLFAPLVYFWLRQGGMQAADAEDVAQEVFRTVADRIEEFRRDPRQGSFRGWLRTITRHKVGDYLRGRKRWAELVNDAKYRLDTAESEPREWDEEPRRQLSPEVRLLHARVIEMIQTDFSPETWQSFFRVVVDGVAPRDVAEEMNLSVNSVYLAKSRVLRRLRDELRETLP